MQINSLKFKCPKCGNNTLEEVLTDVTVATRVDGITSFGEPWYGEQTNEGGEFMHFGCECCDFKLPSEIQDGRELAEWIRENCNG